jgi:hypothetical protein
MARSICKKFSNVSLTSAFLIAALVSVHGASAYADVSLDSFQATHYTETSWLSQYDDLVVTSKLKLDVMHAGPVRAYGGAVLEQDSRSSNGTIYNDNGVSPMVGAWMPLFIPQLALFTEYRQTFRVINKPESRTGSQPDLLLGGYGYQYWSLVQTSEKSSLFTEAYGDLISRSKLEFNPMLESWSKSGMRWALAHGFSADAFWTSSSVAHRPGRLKITFRLWVRAFVSITSGKIFQHHWERTRKSALIPTGRIRSRVGRLFL